MRRVTVHEESWPIAGTFRIARGAKRCARVVVVEVTQGSHVGRGEGVPYDHFGESVERVLAVVDSVAADIGAGMTRTQLQSALDPGAGRNALDCALWDLESQLSGEPVWSLAGLQQPAALTTAYTISLAAPAAMEQAARAHAQRPLLKLKLDGVDDVARVAAVRRGAPDARLIVDANESWTPAQCRELPEQLAALGVELIEQPLPRSEDAPLSRMRRPLPICADEACHDRSSLPALLGRYDAVNIKLDKTGGLTEALQVRKQALAAGFDVMVGCMVSTSLALAPAMLIAEGASFVDLDAGLLLERDRDGGVVYQGGDMQPCPPLWGTPRSTK